MAKQNFVKEKTDEKTDEKSDEKSANVEKFVCPFCKKEYGSKLGLHKHIPRCEASPDEQVTDENDDTDEGIALFDDDEKVVSSPDDNYECGHCGFIMPKPYKRCPDCGEELEWR